MTSGTGTLLHANFLLRNQQAFQRLLASTSGAGDSISLGTSPRSLKSKADDRLDVNARDGFGRTVLHLASASADASSAEYVRLLLKHPGINVNLQDWESHWTPLHRALYVGNIGVVLLLLQHPHTDTTLKDLEGYTAFDLYNSTVEGTKPDPSLLPATSTLSPIQAVAGAELFTWGANRNASLGQGDSSDRTFPDQVPVPRPLLPRNHDVPVEDRFARAGVWQIKMGRLHTGIISTTPSSAGSLGPILSLCGFGSGGRLGVTQHTQYSLRPLSWASAQPQSTPSRPNARLKVISVALGQDHTLALTENGEVYSWGLNRFAQLGYNIDDGSTAAQVFSLDEPSEFIQNVNATLSSNGEQIQLIPRRVYGPLKKEFVLGAAASKNASACWVRDGFDGAGGGGNIYTWGLNGGQLGYDRTSIGTQVQVLPRKVTKITRPVIQIALGESAMACLLGGTGGVGGGWKGDVLIVWGDRVGRISFPLHTFPSPITPYRPPQALKSTRIVKIVCSDETPSPFSSGSLSSSSNAPSTSGSSPLSHTSASNLATLLNSQPSNASQNHINFACVSEGGEVFVFGVPGVPPVGALGSSDGDLDGNGSSGIALAKVIKPQRVWALRRSLVSAVRDVAIGAEGSLIVCTDSGHVYVRARSPASEATLSGLSVSSKGSSGGGGRSQKFSRVPYLQRIVGVCASSTGAFGALRVDAEVKSIAWPVVSEQSTEKKGGRELKKAVDALKGWDVIHDMKSIIPWMWTESIESPLDKEWILGAPDTSAGLIPPLTETITAPSLSQEKQEDDVGEYDDDGDLEVRKDIKQLRSLCALVDKHDKDGFSGKLPYGADLIVSVLSNSSVNTKKGRSKPKSLRLSFPVHGIILCARSSVLSSAFLSPSESILECEDGARSAMPSQIISISPESYNKTANSTRNISFINLHPLAVLTLMHYLYTDELLCIWDRRVSAGLSSQTSSLTFSITPNLGTQIKSELRALASMLALPELFKATESVAKRPVAETLRKDLTAIWNISNPALLFSAPACAFKPDVTLQLAEGHEVHAHSVILRARSEYFDDFLSEEEWTRVRKSPGKLVKVNLQHMRFGVMEYVMKWLCCGKTEGLFGSLDFAPNVDSVLEFLFEVIAIANELLLFPLVLLTSQLVLKFLNIHNACYILSEASHYHAYELVSSVEGYISQNLETFLESHMLELSPSLVKHLSVYIRTQQEHKSAVVRSNMLVNHAMSKWQTWLEGEDIPATLIPSAKRQQERKLSQALKSSSPPSPLHPLSTSFGHQRELRKSTHNSPTIGPQSSASLELLKSQASIPQSDDIFDMDDMDLGLPSIDFAGPHISAGGSSAPLSAWKASSAPRVDMRSIMAETAIASEPQSRSAQVYMTPQARGSPSDGTQFSSGQLRHAGSSQTRPPSSVFDISSTPPSPSPAPRPTGSPWKTTSATASALPVLGSVPAPASKSRESLAPSKARPQLQASKSATAPLFGPVFSPSRQPVVKSQPNVSRKVSITFKSSTAPKAWVSAPTHEPLPPTSTNTNEKGMSFIAIQQLQFEQGNVNTKDKRSLLDIQQEEQAKREEDEFLKWWNQEEERVRLEAQAIEQMQPGGSGRREGSRNQQKKSRKGRGGTPGVSKDTVKAPSGPTVASGSREVQQGGGPSSSSRRGPRGKRGGPPASVS